MPEMDCVAKVESVSDVDQLADHIKRDSWHDGKRALRPRLYCLRQHHKAERIEAASLGLAGVKVIDNIDRQLLELARIRHPRARLTEDKARAYVESLLRGKSHAEYGVWVFYPWSARLVHVLDEPHFIEVRTNRNLYRITLAERDRLARMRVGMVGLSAGQSMALTLAMERCFGELRVADFDTLGLSNLNRLRSGVHNIGLAKVAVTAREIAEIDPYLRVTCYPDGIHAGNVDSFVADGGKLDLIIEECDSIDVKLLLRERAAAHAIPVLMQTSDRGRLDVERFDLEPDRPPFHGSLGSLRSEDIADLSPEDKVPLALNILGVETISSRALASVLEIQQSISTWPQLASGVTLGGALGADTARRLLLGQGIASGRYFVDFDALIPDAALERSTPAPQASAPPWEAPSAPELALHAHAAGSVTAQRLSREAIVDLVGAGIRAPSGGNVQPWHWRHVEKSLFLLRDQRRESPWLAVGGLSSYLALGAATENVVLQAQAQGWDVHLDAPCEEKVPYVARFRFGSGQWSQAVIEDRRHVALASQIPSRHTNRFIRARQPLSPTTMRALIDAAHSVAGVSLRLISGERELLRMQDILTDVNRVLFLSEHSHTALMSELRWNNDSSQKSPDGIDLSTLALKPTDIVGLQICRDWRVLSHLRDWNLGAGLGALMKRCVEGASVIGLITVPDWRGLGFFAAGRAMQRLWLTATSHGVGLQPLSVIAYMYARLFRYAGAGLDLSQTETLQTHWPTYRELFNLDTKTGQTLLFRLCIAPSAPKPSGRHDVSTVLTFD